MRNQGGSGGDVGSDGGSLSDAGSAADGGSDSAAGSGSDAGAGPLDGEPLRVVSVTPSEGTATTRDEISITFNRPVTQTSANGAIAVKNGRGSVAGSLILDGNVVRFKPRGSLCFDQSYTVSIADSLQTPDAVQLEEAGSFSFKILDGAWQASVAIGPSAEGAYATGVDLDDDGNAVVTWNEGTTPVVNHYDARKAAWNGDVRPAFGDTSAATGTRTAPEIQGAHAIAVFGGLGLAETSDGKAWSITPFSTFLSNSSYFGKAGLALASDATTAVVWTDGHELKPASLWSAFHALDSAWQAPKAAFVPPEAYAFVLHALPDNSFLAVYEHRLDQVTPGNLAARRYTKQKGWSDEKQIAAGGLPIAAFDSFGNGLVTSFGNPVARYDYATDLWTAMPSIPRADRVALSGDGTGYAVYVGGSITTKDYYIGLQRLVGNKWSSEEIVLPVGTNPISLAGIAADDCGDVAVVWTDTERGISSARRYTPASGWLPAVTLAKVKEYPDEMAGNARGELLVPYTSEDTGTKSIPKAIRFR